MCLRGHDERYRRNDGGCGVCHADYQRLRYHGQRLKPIARCRLKLKAFRKFNRSWVMRKIELSGRSFNLLDWIYGSRRNGVGARTILARAQAFCDILGVPFDELWETV